MQRLDYTKLRHHKTSWLVSLQIFCLVATVYYVATDLLFATNLCCSMRTIKRFRARKKMRFDFFLLTVELLV